jgi:hypothetical protein
MFGLRPFCSAAFTSLINAITPVTPVQWGKKGGIKKHEIKKSKRAEIQDAVRLVIDGPIVEEIKEEMIEALQPYVKEKQSFSPFSIDYKRLASDMATVQKLMFMANEMKQEQEDEELLLMLL